MKAQVCESAVNVLGLKSEGKVQKSRKGGETEEIQMYLAKLKKLVPYHPRNRKVSKLETIQYVIDYICDLQYALETHPVSRGAANNVSPSRQPLGVISNANSIPNTCATQEVSQTEKVPESEVDSRPVSC